MLHLIECVEKENPKEAIILTKSQTAIARQPRETDIQIFAENIPYIIRKILSVATIYIKTEKSALSTTQFIFTTYVSTNNVVFFSVKHI